MQVLNEIGFASGVLFIVGTDGKLLGSLTDGDIRRGLLKDASVQDAVSTVMQRNCRQITQSKVENGEIRKIRAEGIFYVPVVDDDGFMTGVLDLHEFREIIPVHAVLMAGGKGQRLMPLTKDIPKPLLKIGDKPIIEHNIDRLLQFGVKNIHISINHLGHLIENFFGDGSKKEVCIDYIREEEPLGTIGSVTLVPSFQQQVVLVMNSDLLTNIDYGDFYRDFLHSGADMAVATVPHHVDLPYAIMELDEKRVISFQEKPRYTYFANAGIYLVKAELLSHIPKGKFYNATDLMEKLIAEKKKLINYPILEYWLDIGRIIDYQKAQEDIKHLNW